jgi:hypothetical protein
MRVNLILIGAPGSVSARLAGKLLAPHAREAVLSAYNGHTSDALWLALNAKPLAHLAGSIVSKRKRQDLLLLEPVGSGDREVLGALFRQVLAKDDGVQFLPVEELVEVLTSPSRADLFIGGSAARPTSRSFSTAAILSRWWCRPASSSQTREDRSQTSRASRSSTSARPSAWVTTRPHPTRSSTRSMPTTAEGRSAATSKQTAPWAALCGAFGFRRELLGETSLA